jgi:solute:Na+ symporter, SSS family
VSSFPLLGATVLPIGLYGIFAVGMLATVISTADSYLFIAASTVGKDILCGWLRQPEKNANLYTKISLLLGSLLTIGIAMYFESVVTIWYSFGSIGTPILLVPLFTSFFGKRRMRSSTVMISMIVSGALSAIWLWSKTQTPDGGYWLGLEPIFPGLIVSLLFYLIVPKTKIPHPDV